MSKKRSVLVVHGGAWDIPDNLQAAHLQGMGKALNKGWMCLSHCGSALDAVEETVAVMEDDPVFDAGKGSVLNTDGSVEMDASIMDGKRLEAGAVAALRNFTNPVRISRKILEKTEHILLAGKGCEAFALKQGFKKVPVEDLLTERELLRLKELKKNQQYKTEHSFSKKRGTVGAVAVDMNGDIAAATSTGGTPKKIPGRVGDTPIIGCGTYAENGVGCVSCTGWGESIMKTMLARETAEKMRAGNSAQVSAEYAVTLLQERCKGLAGIICIDGKGRIGIYFNTPKMARGYMSFENEKPVVKI
ncbi:MAG: isoaspartyl peptidase/L-asparaginase [bacterium]